MRAGLIVALMIVLTGCGGRLVTDEVITEEPAEEAPFNPSEGEDDGAGKEEELPKTPFEADIFLESGEMIQSWISSVGREVVVIADLPCGASRQIPIFLIDRFEVADEVISLRPE